MKQTVFAASLLVQTLAFAQTEIMPKSPFDEADAKQRMEKGSSTVYGKVIVNEGLGRKVYFAPAGTLVFLYPLTPYIEEYVSLKEKYLKDPNYAVYLHEIPGKYRLQTEVKNRDGEFEFTNLKPGTYMLTSTVNYTGFDLVKVATGQTVYTKGNTVVGYGGTQYTNEKRYYNGTEYETATVTIKKDGGKKKVNL